MGRIADAAVDYLHDGPAALVEIAQALVDRGVTRAKDPIASVRTALRHDRRVIDLADGRLADRATALNGVVLTTMVSEQAHLRGLVEIDGDLAPLGVVGIEHVAIPADVSPGDYVAVRVDDVDSARILVERAPSWRVGGDAEQLLIARIGQRLADTGPDTNGLVRVRVVDAFCAITAESSTAFRRANRPLSEALADAGLEMHLGWVAAMGARWDPLTEHEIDALERGVADFLAADQPGRAAALQDRVVSLLRRHLPERVPEARRRLARVLARAGRTRDGLAVLTGAFGFDDPEDRYEACLLAIRLGDIVSARRWAEEGLARTRGRADAEVAACLDDLAGDLDAQAAYREAQEWIPEISNRVGVAERLVAQILAPHRSYLVGALIEQVFGDLDESRSRELLENIGHCGSDGRDVCLACAAVLEGPRREAALQAAKGTQTAARPWIEGLRTATVARAWIASAGGPAAQQHLIFAVEKEQGRWSPLVVVIDQNDLDGAARDAFFLNDVTQARFARELLRPITELGLPVRPISVEQATNRLVEALAMTTARGWKLPALAYQPVLARIARMVLPASGISATQPPPDPS